MKDGDYGSNPVASLNPVGTWKSGELTPNELVIGVHEIQPQLHVPSKTSKYSNFQAPAEPMIEPISIRQVISVLPFVYSVPKTSSVQSGHIQPNHSAPPLNPAPKRMINNSTTPVAAPSTKGVAYSPAHTRYTRTGVTPLVKAIEKKITGKADQELISTRHAPSKNKPSLQPSESPPIIRSNNIEVTIGAGVLPTPTNGGATEVICDLAAGSASQAVPSCSADYGLMDDPAVVEWVSRNGGIEWVDGSSFGIPLNIVTNM